MLKVWVLMDRKRQVIACGEPKNRYVVLRGGMLDNGRYLTYKTRSRARMALNAGWIFPTEGVLSYLRREYGEPDQGISASGECSLRLEPVFVTLTMTEIDPTVPDIQLGVD